MGNEYKTHSFKKDWHDQVEKFIEEHEDLAFDSPKYFIKFCVNKYMDEKNPVSKEEAEAGLSELSEKIDKLVNKFDE